MTWITDDVMATMNPPDYLIEDILVAGTAAALVGAAGAGKTFVALDMAFCIAAGAPWHGFRTQRGSVVYILAEGLGGLRQRVLAWRLDRGIPPGVPVGVHFWDRAVQLAHFPSRHEFLAKLNEVQPAPSLIVVDTLARCFVGRDENAAGDMGEFVQGIDTLRAGGATVLVLHHEGHVTGRERGSTALRGAVDAMMYLTVGEAPNSLVLASLKQREGETWDPIELRKRQVELPDETTSCVIDDAPAAILAASLPPRWAEAVRVLEEQYPDGAAPKQWQRATDLSKATFHRMRREVIARGFVEQVGELYRRKRDN